MRTQRLLVAALVSIPLVLLSVWAIAAYWPHDPPPPLAAPRNPVLPDLTMPPLIEFLASVEKGGEKQQLFFSASIANVGSGPFRVHAVRGDERGRWRVSQRFREHGGSVSELVTPATLVWGGHGHNHWHVQLGASYQLRSQTGQLLRSYEKVGYCFFDQVVLEPAPVAAPSVGRFPKDACSDEDALSLDMGLSRGWEDPYTWVLPDQRLEITGLPDGQYRLWAKADPGNLFRESNETNNVAWADIRLTTSESPPLVKVLRRSPS